MISRRQTVIALGVGSIVSPFGVIAQQPTGKVFRMGFLGSTSAAGYANQVQALRGGLRDLGYVEGRNIHFEWRFAEGNYSRLPLLAAELAQLQVDVIVLHGTPGTRAAKQATTTIPIVMAAVVDPIATGLVAGLARPEGNVTGLTYFGPELAAKRIELLKDAMPRISRVAVLTNPDNPVNAPALKAMEITAKSLKITLEVFEVRGPGEFDSTFAAMARKRIEAVAINEDAIFISQPGVLAGLAAKQRLPSIGFTELGEAGSLMSYGVNLPELFRRAAFLVDKIFKGAKPAEIPIEQATKFELLVNVKTANALGIKIPQSILLRADKVIE